MCLAALSGVDSALKRASTAGYCPDGTEWTLETADLGEFWSSFVQTHAATEAAKAFTEFIATFQQQVRLSLGIRPTMLRWRVWMGDTLLVTNGAKGLGACVRPGLLLRVVDEGRRVLGKAPLRGTILTYGPWSYAWHNGFLIFSQSRDYIEAALKGQAVNRTSPRGTVQFRVTGTGGFTLALQGTEGLPLSGRFACTLSHGTTPLTLPDAWPGTPIASVSVRKPRELATLAALAKPVIANTYVHKLAAGFTTVWKHWGVPSLPADWEGPVAETSMALMALDMSSGFPTPVLAGILRGTPPLQDRHPLESLATDTPAYPCEWNGEPGVRISWLGEDLTVCLGRVGRDWLATSREPVMAQLAPAKREGPETDADVAIRMDWAKAGQALNPLIHRLVEWEWILDMNERDMDRRFGPVFDFLSHLGQLTLNGRQDAGTLMLDGFIAQPVVNAKEQK